MNALFERIRAGLAAGRVVPVIGADAAGSEVRAWLADLALPYLVDLSRDTGMQTLYASRAHTLVAGAARGPDDAGRFRLYRHDGARYSAAVGEGEVEPRAPVLFKPRGTVWPEPTCLPADGGFVEYVSDLLGGLAIPRFLRNRRGLRYLVGAPVDRGTQRVLLSDVVSAAAQPAGWALIPGANEEERRFYARLGLQVIDADLRELAGLTVEAAA